MRLLYVVDNSFYDFKPQKPSLVTIRSIVIEHTLRDLLEMVKKVFCKTTNRKKCNIRQNAIFGP